MFALSPLVSHLISDSRLPPLDTRRSGAELAGITKEEEKEEQFKQYFRDRHELGEGVFEVVWLPPCIQGTLVCQARLMSAAWGQLIWEGSLRAKTMATKNQRLFSLRFEGRERRDIRWGFMSL